MGLVVPQLRWLYDYAWFAGFFVWRMYADPDDVSQEAEWGFSPLGKLAELEVRDAFAARWSADAVLLQEDASRAIEDGVDRVTVGEAVAAGQWVRRAGHDFSEGEALLAAPRRLRQPLAQATLTALGAGLGHGSGLPPPLRGGMPPAGGGRAGLYSKPDAVRRRPGGHFRPAPA